MSQNVGRLGVVMGLDTAEFVSGLNKAKNSLQDFAKTAIPKVLGVGAVAFSAMTYKALEFADQISDTAKANDVAIESILKLSSSLQLAGGKGENASKMLASFNSKVDEAAQGSKSAQESFSRIGISLQDIAKLSTEQLFEKSVASLAKISDTATRTKIAIELFGKAIKGVDVKELAEGIARGDEEYKKYAESIRIAGELNDKLESKTKKTVIMFTNTFVPAMNTVFDSMNKSGSAFETFMYVGGEAFQGLIYGGRTLVTLLQTINASVNLTALSFKALVTGSAGDIPKLIKEYDEYVGKLRKGDKEFAKQLRNPEKSKQKDKEKFEGRDVIDADAEAVKKAQALSIEYAQQSWLKFEQLKRQKELIAMTTNEKAVAEAVYKIEDERFNKVLDLQKKIAEEKAKGKPNRKLIEELELQIEVINGVADAYKRLTEEEMLAQQEAQRTFEFGWNKAFKQYSEDAGNYAKVASDMFTSMTSNMNTALDNFVKTGKLNFKDLAKSIIQDLIAIQLKASAMRMFSGAGGFFSSLFGGGSTGLASLPSSVNRTFADGGEPPVGVPSLVGERGPELFIPKTSGTIIPNNQLGSAIGGQTVNYNGPFIANMNAIDTQSATQFIMKNKDSIWSANQSANRSMPASR